MTSSSTTIRVHIDQREELRRLANERGSTMSDTLTAALSALKRELFYAQMAAAEARLRDDDAGWQSFVDERAEWLGAGLESA